MSLSASSPLAEPNRLPRRPIHERSKPAESASERIPVWLGPGFLEPRFLSILQLRSRLLQLRLQLGDSLLASTLSVASVPRTKFRRRDVRLVGPCLLSLKNAKKLKVLVLRDRIVLVRMALGTSHRGPHPDGHRRVDAIDDGNVAKLLVVGAAFVVGQRVAMKRRRDQLFIGRVRAASRRQSVRS